MAGRPMHKGGFATALPWLLGLAALMAAAVLAPGASGFAALGLIAWPVAAWMNEKQGWPGFTVLMMTGMASVLILDGPLAWTIAIWCMGGVVALALAQITLLPGLRRPRWYREGWIHGSVAVVSLVAVILYLRGCYPGGIAKGVTTALVTAIGNAPNGAELLFQLHQAGFVPLDHSMTLLTEGADGLFYMTDEVRLQLLFGLRPRLEEALTLAIPSCAVYLVALTALLAVMLPVTARRRRGEKDDTPRFDKWRLPKEAGLPVACLLIGGAFPMFTGIPAIVAMGQMTSAVASVVFGVLGAAVMRFASRLSGRRPVITWVMILLAAVCVPQLLTLLGVLDQVMDMRKLRKINESEDDRV